MFGVQLLGLNWKRFQGATDVNLLVRVAFLFRSIYDGYNVQFLGLVFLPSNSTSTLKQFDGDLCTGKSLRPPV